MDKAQKRKDIALACQELIFELGIKKLSVAQVAKTAKVGKGTIYEYFENKDDIVFEIINIHIQKEHDKFLRNIKDIKTIRQKVFYFFDFVMNDTEENLKHLNSYKEYLSVVLGDDNIQMKDFNNYCYDFFKNQIQMILEDGIKKGELIKESIYFVDGIMQFEKGVIISKMTQNNFDEKNICENFVNSLFDILEKNKGIK